MRRNLFPFLYPFALSAAALATYAVFSTTGADAASGAPGKTHKPAAPAAPKRPKLLGESVTDDDLEMRFVVPDGWAAAPNTAHGDRKYRISPMYYYVNSTDNLELKGRITYYNPPQFHIELSDLTGTVNENRITNAELDDLTKSIIKQTNKMVLNFRFDGSRRITVDGEAASAFAAVGTSQITQEVVRLRVVSLFRNKRVYLFVFEAPVDDFPRYDPTFAKVLQNYHFLTPRKKNPTPPPPADSAPPSPNSI